jgi:urease accessory protein
MRRATKVLGGGQWEAQSECARVVLGFEDRYRRRIQLHDSNGEPFLLDLARPTSLRDGDGLVLENGGVILVVAAEEAVADIRAASPAETARIAWHIGNRHTPVQILKDGALRIRDDHVLIEMIEALGGIAERRKAPFSPEGGAYSHGLVPGHSHAHLRANRHDA